MAVPSPEEELRSLGKPRKAGVPKAAKKPTSKQPEVRTEEDVVIDEIKAAMALDEKKRAVYTFVRFPGNNFAATVGRCMKRRPYWDELDIASEDYMLCWKPTRLSSRSYSNTLMGRLPGKEKKSKGPVPLFKMINHYEGVREICTKAKMFANMCAFYESQKLNVFEHLPLTFSVAKPNGAANPHLKKFRRYYALIERMNKQDEEKAKNPEESKEGKEAKEKKAEGAEQKEVPSPSATDATAPTAPAAATATAAATDGGSGEEKKTRRKAPLRGSKKEPEVSLDELDAKTRKAINAVKAMGMAKNLWIVKPTHLNRGQKIFLSGSLNEIERHVAANPRHQWIVQKYIERPLLFHSYKFDIRCWVAVSEVGETELGPNMERPETPKWMTTYLYRHGYLRLSGVPFTLDTLDTEVHLTNNAVQKHLDTYSKVFDGNQVSYTDFENYINETRPNLERKFNMEDVILPKMKEMIKNSIAATNKLLTPRPSPTRLDFELFGYDFMIADDLTTVMMIEINTNPCLELSSGLLKRILPRMVEDLHRAVIDPIFPPPQWFAPTPQSEPTRPNDWELLSKLPRANL